MAKDKTAVYVIGGVAAFLVLPRILEAMRGEGDGDGGFAFPSFDLSGLLSGLNLGGLGDLGGGLGGILPDLSSIFGEGGLQGLIDSLWSRFQELMPDITDIPGLPDLPEIPDIPRLPFTGFDFPDFSFVGSFPPREIGMGLGGSPTAFNLFTWLIQAPFKWGWNIGAGLGATELAIHAPEMAGGIMGLTGLASLRGSMPYPEYLGYIQGLTGPAPEAPAGGPGESTPPPIPYEPPIVYLA